MHGIVFDAPARLNPPMWSLEIEVLFYALLPLLMLAYCRVAARPARLALMAVVIAMGIVASSLLVASAEVDLRLRWGLFHHAYLFLMGVVMADLVGDVARGRGAKSAGFDALFAAGLALLIGIGLMMTRHDARMPGTVYALAIQAATIAALLLVFFGALRGRLASAALSLPWVRLVGTMCYSLYLIHIVVMTAVGEVLPHVLPTHSVPLIYLVYVGTLTGASLVAGAVFYVAVERPFARRLSRPRPAAPLPSGARLGEAR